MRDYLQQMTVEQFGAMVATASAEVGSPAGVYIGHTPSGAGRPVRYDPTEAPRTARPSGVLLAGTLGSRQDARRARRSPTPPSGAARWSSTSTPSPTTTSTASPSWQGEVEVLELSGDPRHRGKLDPLAIGLPELREELASSYLLELLRDPPPSWENAIDRAVRDAVRAGERSLLCVIARLRESEAGAAREAGEALEVLSDFGLARLGFADGEERAGCRGEPSVITIRTPGLSLPDPGASRETYTRAERVSVATLSLVAAQALRLVSQRPLSTQDRAAGRGVVSAGLDAGPAAAEPAGPARSRHERDDPAGDPAARRPRRPLRAGRGLLPLRPGLDPRGRRALEMIGLDPDDAALRCAADRIPAGAAA